MDKIFEKPTILVVFGATGDLMDKKIAPSLYYLHKNRKLPSKFKVLGFSRSGYGDKEFKKFIFDILKKNELVKKSGKEKEMEKFLELFHFQKGKFGERKDYLSLAAHMQQIDDQWGVCSNKLFYLAVPPGSMKDIVVNLEKTGLSEPCGGPKGWSRVIVEKPFGRDSKTAQNLEKLLSSFKQEQIYRIDHYLGKEMVQGILNFRFSNNLLEHNWSNQHIEKIEMRLLEKIGVDKRGLFYESVGALRDVGQNHLLEILALLTMDMPASNSPDAIRKARAKALESLRVYNPKEISNKTFRAQYDGYGDVEGVKANSKIETYFKINVELENNRWSGVPITMESGKMMGKVQKEVVVTFKHPRPCLCQSGQDQQNKVIFSLHPKQGITIKFLAKEPGFTPAIESRSFDFMLYEEKSKVPYIEEYAKLLFDCINGNQTWFVSKDEIKYMWGFTDPIINAWQNNSVPLYFYKKNKSDIVLKADNFFKKNEELRLSTGIGIIGLGKMGANLARRLVENEWDVVGYNKTKDATKSMEKEGLRGAYSIKELVEKLNTSPRIVWLMVPAGKPVDEVLFGKDGLVNYLEKGDIIIDGGNSYYKNTIKRHKKVSKYGIHYMDCGVSGGPGGARNGACLMIGGNKKIFKKIEPLFRDMAQENGYQFFPGVGAGHFVKMVHNGIEYGMMQAIAEGFAIMKKSKYKLDLTKVSDVYNNGSVIESSLIRWLREAYDLYGEDLAKISGQVHHSGEGQWTVKTAKEMKVIDKVISEAYKFRLRSQKHPSYTGKVVSALRGQFGQHPVLKQSKQNRQIKQSKK